MTDRAAEIAAFRLGGILQIIRPFTGQDMGRASLWRILAGAASWQIAAPFGRDCIAASIGAGVYADGKAVDNVVSGNTGPVRAMQTGASCSGSNQVVVAHGQATGRQVVDRNPVAMPSFSTPLIRLQADRQKQEHAKVQADHQVVLPGKMVVN